MNAPIITPAGGCARKRYGSKAAAESALFTMRARGSDTDRLQVRECLMCKSWHLQARKGPTPQLALATKRGRGRMPYNDE